MIFAFYLLWRWYQPRKKAGGLSGTRNRCRKGWLRIGVIYMEILNRGLKFTGYGKLLV
jgi:hypothetical protein